MGFLPHRMSAPMKLTRPLLAGLACALLLMRAPGAGADRAALNA